MLLAYLSYINNPPYIIDPSYYCPFKFLTQADSVLGEGSEPFFEGRARDGTASRGSPFSQTRTNKKIFIKRKTTVNTLFTSWVAAVRVSWSRQYLLIYSSHTRFTLYPLKLHVAQNTLTAVYKYA